MKKHTILLLLLSILPSCNRLEKGFQNPPAEARPLVWWHWMNGNITEDGIRKDLLWMDSIGIAGFHLFDAGLNTPKIVDERLDYMSPGWCKAFRTALSLADSLGMEVGVPASPGWSSSGGPWVETGDAMKKIVWREVRLSPGEHFNGPLPEGFEISSTFQDMPLDASKGAHEDPSSERFYEDISVLALKLPEADRTLSQLGCTISSSSGNFTLEQLTNDSMGDFVKLESSENMWIDFSFPQPQSIASISFVPFMKRERGHALEMFPWGELQLAEGREYRKICDLEAGSASQTTISFPPVSGTRFRVRFYKPFRSDRAVPGNAKKYVPCLEIAKLVLSPVGRVNHFEEKAAFAACQDISDHPTPSSCEAVGDVIDITEHYKDGVLDWTAPSEGNWAVLRIGASLTGKKNHPASPEATGLEVSKLDPEAWTKYFTHYLNMYKEASGGLMGRRGLQYLLTDSYEAHHDNGSRVMIGEFRKRRGYDPVPWLPVMTGYVVGSAEQSDAFLWDWRRTEGELFAENYQTLSSLVREKFGMKGCYIESHENGRVFPSDGMDIKRKAEFPMSACWLDGLTSFPDRASEGRSDIRESASVAHIFGQNRVAAESFTQNGALSVAYSSCPSKLKRTADMELASGLNRFVIHESSHQPSDSHFPGLTLGRYGQWFTRHETWAGMARPWIDYLSRSSYMLMQGRFVADILYYYGEDSNVTALFSNSVPSIPDGFAYDYANPTVLKEMLRVDGGTLKTKTGMSYRILYIDRSCVQMSCEILRRIRDFAEGGVVICGRKPLRTTGLKESREVFDALVEDIWSRPNVIEGELEDAVRIAGLAPDVIWEGDGLQFVHRKLRKGDIFWVSNCGQESYEGVVDFNVSGSKPELWNPETGKISGLSWKAENGRTKVDVKLSPDDAFFVVFRSKTGSSSGKCETPVFVAADTLKAGWTISFQEGRGADGLVIENAGLGSLSEMEPSEVKYFSGVSIYKTAFTAPSSSTVLVDLGDVREVARVLVDGKDAGIVWRKPFRVDVSEFVSPGKECELEVRVGSSWRNRLIGDLQPGATRVAFCGYKKYFTASDPLSPSGLLGPVVIMTNKN